VETVTTPSFERAGLIRKEKLMMQHNVLTQAEFSGIRSQYYKEIMLEMPEARLEERKILMNHLSPKTNEKILEIGAGTGFYSQYIAQLIFPGTLIASDPSAELLSDIPIVPRQNIKVVIAGADTLPVGEDPLEPCSFDAVWAFGCFHHVPDKTTSFKNLYLLLKPGGRVMISDVFAGTKLAQYFDLAVAKYCATGHEVSFLSREFADSLCYLTGFEKPTFHDVKIPINFKSREDIGYFIYKLNAMIGITPEKCLKYVSEFLDIEHKNGLYTLIWPHTVLSTRKGVYE
jgi:SAM-dependent methyltransferase